MRSRRSSLNSSDRSPCRRQRRGERSMTIEAQAQKFLVQLGNLGGSAGNGSLRDKLGWTEKTYKRVRQELLDIGSIEVGRGRGGSVKLIAKSARRTHGVRVTVAPPPRRDGGQRSSRMPAAMARVIHAPIKRSTPPVVGTSTVHSRVETYQHTSSTRKNIPTAEMQPVMRDGGQDAAPAWHTSGATGISTRNSSGAARTSRTGPTSSSRRRRSTSRRRCTPRC